MGVSSRNVADMRVRLRQHRRGGLLEARRCTCSRYPPSRCRRRCVGSTPLTSAVLKRTSSMPVSSPEARWDKNLD